MWTRPIPVTAIALALLGAVGGLHAQETLPPGVMLQDPDRDQQQTRKPDSAAQGPLQGREQARYSERRRDDGTGLQAREQDRLSEAAGATGAAPAH